MKNLILFTRPLDLVLPVFPCFFCHSLSPASHPLPPAAVPVSGTQGLCYHRISARDDLCLLLGTVFSLICADCQRRLTKHPIKIDSPLLLSLRANSPFTAPISAFVGLASASSVPLRVPASISPYILSWQTFCFLSSLV